MSERKVKQMTPEQAEAAKRFLADLMEMVESKGKHEGHRLEQIGRCVYCSCGGRYQRRKP